MSGCSSAPGSLISLMLHKIMESPSFVLCLVQGEGVWGREELGSQGDCNTSLSAGSLDRGEFALAESDTEGLEQCAEGYREGDRVLVLYGKGKTLRTYEAKVKEVERGEERCDYLVHYSGWNSRYDEWIDSGRIAGKITGTAKPRPHFNTVSYSNLCKPSSYVAKQCNWGWRVYSVCCG